jgi:hypothetical protein
MGATDGRRVKHISPHAKGTPLHVMRIGPGLRALGPGRKEVEVHVKHAGLSILQREGITH